MFMNKLKGIVGVLATVCALNANAAVITSADLSSVNITAGAGWSWQNIDALFNGITNNVSTQTERFVALRNSGDAISTTNPFIIDVGFNDSYTVESVSFFNDWGQLLQQQVDIVAIEFLSMGSVINLLNTSGLAQNTFDEISLGSGLSIANVDQMKFVINGITGTNFEIRELVVGVADQADDVIEASAPAFGILLLLGVSGLLLRRR